MNTLEPLVVWDWLVIAMFFAATLGIGLYFSRRAVSSLADYFVAGRKMTWWVAGTSIVATSFAADTPLVISGWSRTIGLQRNWFWWGGIMGFMLCTFFYARLWRRADVLTDVEFNELRYSGKPAAGLRMFHATYISLIRNTLVMAWVTLAMTKILDVTFDIPTLVFVKDQWLPVVVAKGIDIASVIAEADIAVWPMLGQAILPAKAIGILLCFGVAAGYSAISGLWGVMATDFFQFIFAMTGTVILMVAVLIAAGGPTSMVEQADRAVREGRVHNTQPTQRLVVEQQTLIDKLAAPPPKDQHDTQALARQEAARTVIDYLVEIGLFKRSPDNRGSLLWNVHGRDRQQIEAGVVILGLDAQEDLLIPGAQTQSLEDRLRRIVLDLWASSYTFSKAGLTDTPVREKLLDAGLIEPGLPDKPDAPINHYRFTDLSLSEQALQDRLAAAGIDRTGEIMGAWRKDRVVSSRKVTSFLPPFDLEGGGKLVIWSFIVFIGLQWWAGGAGDGFLAQRLFSCKDEKHSVFAMLWYNFAMFVMRPWPWIVVGTASLFLVPDVTAYGAHYDAEHAYVIMLMKYLPVGLKGLMVAALMAAYMSTISTHVNYGASYVVNDLYKRFIRPKGSERETIFASQVATVVLAVLAGVYAFYATSIGNQWFIYFEMLSGAGLVIPLRWYWWRVNAWTELSAMCASIGIFLLLRMTTLFHSLFEAVGLPAFWLEEYSVRFTLNIVLAAMVWLTVTFLTKPEKEEHLVRFYNRVRPGGWWQQVAIKAGNPDHLAVGRLEWACWALGVTGLFAMIFSLGKACFGLYTQSLGFAAYAVVATFLMFKLIGKMDWSSITQPEEDATADTA